MSTCCRSLLLRLPVQRGKEEASKELVSEDYENMGPSAQVASSGLVNQSQASAVQYTTVGEYLKNKLIHNLASLG